MERERFMWVLYILYIIFGGIAFLGLRSPYRGEAVFLGLLVNGLAIFLWFTELWDLKSTDKYNLKYRWRIFLVGVILLIAWTTIYAYTRWKTFAGFIYTCSYVYTTVAWLLVGSDLDETSEPTL